MKIIIITILILIPIKILAPSPPPTLVLTVPTTAFVNEPIIVDARLSTGICTGKQSDSTDSIIITYGDGLGTGLIASGHAYRTTGSFTVGITAKDCAGASASTSVGITISNIPTATGGNIQTLTDTGNAVNNATNLQNAINTAKANNTTNEQEIIAPAGTIFKGPIVWGTPTGSKYITLKSANLNNLPPRVRVSPANSSHMAIILTPSSGGNAVPGLTTSDPAVNPAPHHYRLQGFWLKKDIELNDASRLMNIGVDSGAGQDTLGEIPHHFIVDRCYFDGGEDDASETTNAIRIYADYVSVVDSYLGDFRLIDSGVDSAAISTSSSKGPFAFVNNTIVASSENFCSCGSSLEYGSATIASPTTTSATLSNVTGLELDQNIALPIGGVYAANYSTIVRSIAGNNITFDAISSAPDNAGTAKWGAVPSYMEIRQNYLPKRLEWRASDPSYNGLNTQIKNLFEAKQGRYLTVIGNVFRYTWIKDQDFAITLSPRNNGSVTNVFRDFEFVNNIVRDAGKGITVQAADYAEGLPNQRAQNITIRNNLFWNVGINWDGTGAGHQFILIQQGGTISPQIPVLNMHIIHNTYDNGMPLNDFAALSDFGSQFPSCTNCSWLNNMHRDAGLGFNGTGFPNQTTVLNSFFPPADLTNINKNIIVNMNYGTFPSGFTNQVAVWTTGVFVNYATGNFKLQDGTAGKNAALDGTDIGVNMDVLNAATLHSIDGNQGIITCNWSTSPACN